MKNIIYFFQFIFISIFFVIFKLIGYKNASNLGCFLGKKLGPKFRSKKIVEENFRKFNPNIDDNKLRVLINEMWGNYGRIFAEYVFIPSFRKNKYEKFLKVEGLNNYKVWNSTVKAKIYSAVLKDSDNLVSESLAANVSLRYNDTISVEKGLKKII